MIPDQKVKMKWNTSNKRYYENKGYVFTKRGDEFEVSIHDLPPKTNVKVKVICDNCGAEYNAQYSKLGKNNYCPKCHKKILTTKTPYEQVKKELEELGCELLTPKEEYKNTSSPIKYVCINGHIAQSSFSGIKQRQSGTCRKCRTTSIEEICKEFERHGCKLLSTEYARNKKLDYICSCGNRSKIRWKEFKAGKRCNACRVERIKKMKYRNGTEKISLPQAYIYTITGGELNYPVLSYSLDVALVDEKIYIEYDGGGHDLLVKLGVRTEEEQKKIELIRETRLHHEGWKRIRIISRRDNLPDIKQMRELINQCIKYLNTEGSWIHIDIDQSVIYCSRYKINITFEELLAYHTIEKRYGAIISEKMNDQTA